MYIVIIIVIVIITTMKCFIKTPPLLYAPMILYKTVISSPDITPSHFKAHLEIVFYALRMERHVCEF